ncbi:hypothetical protein ASG42_26875 [Rhizobium sp. Leaf391]|nr:hypothetical protein ASG42_26875 [Rhizobium sp. Leaf391]
MAIFNGDLHPAYGLDFLPLWRTKGTWQTGTTTTDEIYYRRGDIYSGYETTLKGSFEYTVDPVTKQFEALSGTVHEIHVKGYFWTDDSGKGFWTESYTVTELNLDISLFDSGLSAMEIAAVVYGGNDSITGSRYMRGFAGDDTLTGSNGYDTLNGGTGADTMAGGLSGDLYYVDDAGDVVTELINQGNDTVESSVSFVLSANVEQLRLVGADINGTGNALNNTLVGTSGINVLDGQGGADTMAGGLSDDLYYVDDAGDVVTELINQGNDTVESSVSFVLSANVEQLRLVGTDINGTGNALNNTLIGTSGMNILDGKGGADTMAGGLSDDLYHVDDAGDIVTELINQGNDTVESSVSFVLSANVEQLDAGDIVTELINQGNDTVESSVSFVLSANVEQLSLVGANINGTGNALNNTLIGSSGMNILDGKGGADTMAGGRSNDLYHVDDAGDIVTELINQGNDTVESSVSFVLSANVEQLMTRATS